MEKEIIELMNQERINAGLSPLIVEESYYPYVQLRANECNEVFSHTRPNGKRFFTVYDENSANVGIWRYGENIGQGVVRDPAQILAAFMNSQGHREIILDPAFTHVCVAIVPRTNVEESASKDQYVVVLHFYRIDKGEL